MIHFTLVVIIVTQGAAPPQLEEQSIVHQDEQPLPHDPTLIYRTCDKCAWTNGYETEAAAKMGAASHRRWCRDGHGRKKNLFG
jgi:hypothetical protein